MVGDTLVLTYDEELDTASTPAAGAYTVTVAGTARTVSGVEVSGRTVTLTLSSAVNPGQSVTVSYAVPSTNPVQDVLGNDAEPLTNEAVTNNTTATIISVEVTSTPRGIVANTYVAGEEIQFTVTFSHAVDVSTSRPHLEFSLGDAGGGEPKNAAYESGTGTTELVFAYTVQAGDSDNHGIWIQGEEGTRDGAIILGSDEYIRTSDTTLDADLTHNDLGTQSGHKVDGSISINDTTAPALKTTGGAVVVGNKLKLGYNEDLDTGSTPAASAYTVTVAGAARTVSGVNVSGRTVTLTLSSAVNPGQSVAVSYALPSTNPVQDLLGNDAAALTGQPVTNNTPATITSVEITSTPRAAAETYGAREVIEITVTFSYAVEVSASPPHFELPVGGDPIEEAVYSSGSGTTALVFAYRVQATDRDNDGVWLGGNRVKLDSDEYIRVLGTTVDADLRHTGADAQAGHKVDGRLSIPNTAPSFANATATRTVPENTGADTNIGDPLPAATDSDGDTLDYTLEGTDAASFNFDAAARRLKTRAALNYETKSSYSVTMKADDGYGDTATLSVTVNVTDVNEKTARPGAPTVTRTTGTAGSLDVSWTAPDLDGGPAITGYEVRYRSAEPVGSWRSHSHSGTDTSTTITGLTAGTDYDVRVRALNGETPSEWAQWTGSTNSAPAFSSATATLTVPENTDADTNIGVALPAATDADSDTLTYTLEGTDAESFNFDDDEPPAQDECGARLRDEVVLLGDDEGRRRLRRYGHAHGDGERDGRGREAGQAGLAGGGEGPGDGGEPGRALVGAGSEGGAGDHGLRRALPQSLAGRVVAKSSAQRHGDEDTDHGPRGREGVRCSGACAERADAERVVCVGWD